MTWQAKLQQWFRLTARDLPWRREDFRESYGAWGTLVSEFMLQQTPATRVVPHLMRWLQRWPSPAALADATQAQVLTQWANLGYPRRAMWLRRTAEQVTERHEGTVPRDVDALLKLSGIGAYTARAVAVFAYGDRHPVVDTNTRRVIARIVHGRAQPDAPRARDLEDMAELLPESAADATEFNAAMMELGATVCTARNPACGECPVVDVCAWRAAGYPASPDRRRKQATYVGSDRQARGAVLKELRLSAHHRLPAADVLSSWPDAAQRERAIDALLGDELIRQEGVELHL